MNRLIGCIALAVALVAISTPLSAQSCGSKENCGGGTICCFGPEGSTPGVPGIAERRGVCTERAECVKRQHENIVVPEGSACAKGNERCTLKLESGASITGCFPTARCRAGK